MNGTDSEVMNTVNKTLDANQSIVDIIKDALNGTNYSNNSNHTNQTKTSNSSLNASIPDRNCSVMNITASGSSYKFMESLNNVTNSSLTSVMNCSMGVCSL